MRCHAIRRHGIAMAEEAYCMVAGVVGGTGGIGMVGTPGVGGGDSVPGTGGVAGVAGVAGVGAGWRLLAGLTLAGRSC